MRGRFSEQAFTRREMLGSAAAAASLAVLPSARADAVEEEHDAYIHRQMRAGRIPGLSVAVVRDAHTIWSRGYGWANIPHELRATKDVEFMLASVSKTVTGVAVMQAVEDGLIDLDADVNEVLPFPVRNPEFPDDPITTRMLLTHTSTISDNWGVLTDVYVEGDSSVALGDFLAGYFTPGGKSYDAERNFLSGIRGRGTATATWPSRSPPTSWRRRPAPRSTPGATSGSSRRSRWTRRAGTCAAWSAAASRCRIATS